MLPLFPLNLVVYPHEDLNLHIFEPRYRQLINECLETELTFGIPSVINNRLMGYGTEMKVTTLSKRYHNGRMDIQTRGLRIFRIVDFENPMPEKLYAGAEVVFVENEDLSEYFDPKLRKLVEEVYLLLKVKVDYESAHYQPLSYRIAHKIGLSIKEEYELLTISTEKARQEKLIKHLERTIPVLIEMERTKERIAMNGHFRELNSPNF